MTKRSIFIVLFAMLTASSLLAESFKISGRVIDNNGKGLIGASIIIDGVAKENIIKDTTGYFQINNISGTKAVIKVSSTGMIPRRIFVTKDSINILIILRSNTFRSKAFLTMSGKTEKNDFYMCTKNTSNENIQNSASKSTENLKSYKSNEIKVVASKLVDNNTTGTLHCFSGNSGNWSIQSVAGVIAVSDGFGKQDNRGFTMRARHSAMNQSDENNINIIDQNSGSVIISRDNYYTSDYNYNTVESDIIDVGPDSTFEKTFSSLLTAGEVNDFTKWNLWTDIANNELIEYQNLWKFTPLERYTVQFQNNNKFPLFGAKVILKDGEKIIWESVTDNTGKAELWNNAFNTHSPVSNNLMIEINYEDKIYEIKNPKIFQDGINYIYSDLNYKASNFADIAFVIDATGSMSDEFNHLKADINNIISSIKDSIPIIDLNIGAVFYRDYGEQFSSKFDKMTNEYDEIKKFIKSVAAGGGKGVSAAQIGLNTAINKLTWRENSLTKIIFLILDAAPSNDINTIDNLMLLTQTAAKKGIRIVPVTCSDMDKSGEYLMRAIALLTNGTYTFLTDDSKIGNKHIKPTTDKYEVETFNALIKRLIKQYLSLPKSDLVINNLTADTTSVEVIIGGPMVDYDSDTTSIKEKTQTPKDTSKVDSNQINLSINPNSNVEKLSIKCYPNPTSGILNIETFGKIDELFISDVSGKLMTRVEVKNQNIISLNLSDYPNGTYYSLCLYDTDKILKGKFIIIH